MLMMWAVFNLTCRPCSCLLENATASRCPFLANEMGKRDGAVVKKASLELEEDVQEMQALRDGTVHISHLIFVKLNTVFYVYLFIFPICSCDDTENTKK